MIKEGRVPIFSNTNQHSSEAETAYHISVERMNYSVPFEYINQKVDVRLTRATVGGLLRWKRHLFPSQAVRPADLTNLQEHMPPEHQKYVSGTVNGSFTGSVKSAATRRSLSKPFSAATR